MPEPDTARTGREGRRRPHAALLACLLVVATVAALAVGTSANGACASCHAMRPFAQRIAGGPHAAASCYDCHSPGGLWGLAASKSDEWFRMYPAAALGETTLTAPASLVGSDGCLRCHASVRDGSTTGDRFRIRHASCALEAACPSCHGREMHEDATRWRRSYVMDECVACHRARGATRACDACHTGRTEDERLDTGPWQVTHGPSWRSTHGMGAIRYCDTCHEARDCVRCHATELPHPADFGRTHGAASLSPGSRCLTCHRQRTCDGCHGVRMPHPGGFVRTHVTEASRRDDPTCLRCHATADCVTCHERHTHPARSDAGEPLPQPKGGR